MRQPEAAIYWDASALLSVLFRDDHSDAALVHVRAPSAHFVSSLAWAEVHAVVSRIERERVISTVQLDAVREVMDTAAWRHLNAVPDRGIVRGLASRWPLRGADLWHLSLAKTLQTDLPDLTFLSYDNRLTAAAQEEGLPAP